MGQGELPNHTEIRFIFSLEKTWIKPQTSLKNYITWGVSFQEVTVQGIYGCARSLLSKAFNLEKNSQRIVGGQAMVIPITLDPWDPSGIFTCIDPIKINPFM